MVMLKRYSGQAVTEFLPEVARLRIEVFREYPYLYDGDLQYEEKYLATYAQSPDCLFVLAFDNARLVGASTGIPLADEDEAFQRPFKAHGFNLDDVFYFGESVLKQSYRGRGIGHRFFDEREAYARGLGRFRYTCFCAVVRDADDPRRPADYRPLDEFWQKRGYQRQPHLSTMFSWKELDETTESQKPMVFWMRSLYDRHECLN